MSDPLPVIQNAYQAFARRDFAEILRLFSPQIEIVQSTELPWGGEFHGHTGMQQFFQRLTGHINSTLEIERFITSGDHVVATGWTKGTVQANGASFCLAVAHVWRVANGQVVQVRFFIDNASMLTALSAQGR